MQACEFKAYEFLSKDYHGSIQVVDACDLH